MQQHPIPQSITTYRFRLVGDMTLKQFLELASGIVIAWLIFNSNLNLLLRWFLGPLVAFFGVALAFIPVEDRPLDQWIINFIKAIYKPTQFLYQAQSKDLDIFSPPKSTPETETPISKHSGDLKEYLKSLPPSPTTAFDQSEQKYLEYIHNLFGALGITSQKKFSTSTETLEPPPLKSSIKGIRVRKLMTPQMCLLPHTTIYQKPPESKLAAMPASAPKPSTGSQKSPGTLLIQKTPKTITKTRAQKPPPSPKVLPAVKNKRPPIPVSQTVFATNIILPQKPEKPNLLAGITLDKNSKIIPNVILEIKNHKGHSVRALKSNKLGQFFIATALEEGIYQIIAEHPGHRFAIMKLEAKGEIIPPLKIQAI